MLPKFAGIFRFAELTHKLGDIKAPFCEVPEYGPIPFEEFEIHIADWSKVLRTDSWQEAQIMCARNPNSEVFGLTFN